MSQPFSEVARFAVFCAIQEVDRRGQREVTPDYLLLGAIRDNDFRAAKVLSALGVPPQRMRLALSALLPPSKVPEPEWVDKVTSEAGERVLDLARKEAAEGGTPVDTEHLLLAVIQEGSSGAARLLLEQGVSLERALATLRTLGTTTNDSSPMGDDGLTADG